jgi:hypothetical protein
MAMPDAPIRAVLLLCLPFAASPIFSATLEPVELESNEGYYQLSWDTDEAVNLIEAEIADFSDGVVVYSGLDSGHVVSGKPDGVWFYRLEAADGGGVLSDPAVITVRHHSLARAFSFFALGAVVFLATLGLIFFARPGSDERA